jgi:hypothetical protein
MFWVTTINNFPAFELDNGLVSGVRLGSAKSRPAFQLVVPVLEARRLGAHEVLIIDRLPPRPDPAGSPEVWDAAAGRKAGSSEDEDPFTVPKIIDELLGHGAPCR